MVKGPPTGSALSQSILVSFQKGQDESCSLSKAVQQLRTLWSDLGGDASQEEVFFEHFIFFLQLPLTRKERTPYVDRCLELACRFVTSFLPTKKAKSASDNEETAKGEDEDDEEEDDDLVELPPLMHRLIHWLLDHHEVEGSSARWRICLMLNRLLKLLGEEASIDDELYQKIFDNMLQRLKDKVVEIRSQAVTALQRLQDPRDSECPIIKAFLFHLSCDPSAIVRRTVIRCIGATKVTLPHILRRTKDVDEGVRKAAFKFVADKIHMRSLTIAQREQVLQRGLTDRADSVRLIAEKELVVAWLRLCNNNVVELLYALDVGSSDGKVASQMIQSLCKDVPYRELVENFSYIDDKKLIPYDKLTAETAIYWRNLASFLLAEGGGALEYLDQILPELTSFCRYIRHFIIGIEKSDDDVTWVFIAKELIEIIKVFDLADEVGRGNLRLLCKDLMSSSKVHASFIEPLMTIFAVVRNNPDDRIQEVAEIIAELRDPMKLEQSSGAAGKVTNTFEEMETESKAESKADRDKREELQRKKQVAIAQVRVKLNIMKNDMEDAIQNRDFMTAQNCKVEMDKLEAEQNQLQDELIEVAAIASRPVFVEEVCPTSVEPESSEDAPKVEEDPLVVQKCLEILYHLLQDTKIKTLSPTLRTLFDEMVLPSLRNLEPEIRISAIRAMGVCCIRSLELAKRNLVLLFQVANMDQSDVRVSALAIVNDLLIWHGLPAFIANETLRSDEAPSNLETMMNNETQDPTLSHMRGLLTQDELNAQGGNSVVALLTRLLDDPDLEVRTKVAEGMCKLLMVGAIASPKLFQRLILMWYNPLAESEGKLRHILGTFFPLYASVSRSNQDSIEEALLPTLKTLFNAPPTSPLGEIDIEDVGLFFLQLTREDFLQVRGEGQGPNVHDSMAFSLSNEILSMPDAYCNKILLKLLVNLQVSTTDFVKLRELKQLCDEMQEEIKEKALLRVLERFSSSLNEHLKKDTLNPLRESMQESLKENAIAERTSENQTNAEDSMNSTKAAKRRMLFSQTQHTLLSSPAGHSDSKNTNTGDSSDVFLTPEEPKLAKGDKRTRSSQKKNLSSEITRIEETSDEDDEQEEETIVSGNLSKKQRAGMTEANKSKGIMPLPQINVVPESSEESDDVENNGSPIMTSTQVEKPQPGQLKTFVASQVGRKTKKIQRTAESSTEEEEEIKSSPVGGNKKRGRLGSKKKSKGKITKASEDDEGGAEQSATQGASSQSSGASDSRPRRQSARLANSTPTRSDLTPRVPQETHSTIKKKNPQVLVEKLTGYTPDKAKAHSSRGKKNEDPKPPKSRPTRSSSSKRK
ncbi:hypothetical protein TCAL_09294 [Tigriopus californicus]|uniref:Nuclear condensin complex subunit 3 C-terminal domain-containing protein n=1 Tax=Tigriopus californicus TaxID=6832 RepID=A0A553NYC0_TIGCA|nr:condensin complex subunit 3-like [Tigriopus californicus]TRY70433.1 hypothetical protein TCAL_09294 [Tigriopus californicus]